MKFMQLIKYGAVALTMLLPIKVLASDMEAPTGEVLLTISGNIDTANVGDTLQLDRNLMEGMSPVTIRTTTIWTDGMQEFTGVPLARLMEAAQAKGDAAKATAINDYAVPIPREDWTDDGAIIAYLNNGDPMSVRDKGPLWVIYPYDSDPMYQSEVIYSRSVWQLDRLVVE